MNERTTKACQVCGKPFHGGADRHYCPDCAKSKKADAAVKIRVCQECGVKFPGGPRAKRCPACAQKAKADYERKPTARPIGSADNCVLCGKAYAVSSGRQKYCPDCRRRGVLEWQRKHKKGYGAESGQDEKKFERRRKAKKICAYCLRVFSDSSPSNVCSERCRSERRKLLQCQADIRRGKNRDLKKYEEKMEQYREECQNDG